MVAKRPKDHWPDTHTLSQSGVTKLKNTVEDVEQNFTLTTLLHRGIASNSWSGGMPSSIVPTK